MYGTGWMTAPIIVAAAVSLLVGCSSKRVDLADADVTLEIESPRTARITSVQVLQHEQGATVHGRIHRPTPPHYAVYGHVDIEVIEPDGRVTRRWDVPLHSHAIPRQGTDGLHFEQRIPTTLPAGTVIRLRQHEDGHGLAARP